MICQNFIESVPQKHGSFQVMRNNFVVAYCVNLKDGSQRGW